MFSRGDKVTRVRMWASDTPSEEHPLVIYEHCVVYSWGPKRIILQSDEGRPKGSMPAEEGRYIVARDTPLRSLMGLAKRVVRRHISQLEYSIEVSKDEHEICRMRGVLQRCRGQLDKGLELVSYEDARSMLDAALRAESDLQEAESDPQEDPDVDRPAIESLLQVAPLSRHDRRRVDSAITWLIEQASSSEPSGVNHYTSILLHALDRAARRAGDKQATRTTRWRPRFTMREEASLADLPPSMHDEPTICRESIEADLDDRPSSTDLRVKMSGNPHKQLARIIRAMTPEEAMALTNRLHEEKLNPRDRSPQEAWIREQVSCWAHSLDLVYVAEMARKLVGGR